MSCELKFLLELGAEAQMGARVGPGRVSALRTIYFDTPDHALRAAGIGLRLRRQGRAWVQTVKVERRVLAGLAAPRRAEATVPGGRIDPAAIPDPELKAAVLRHAAGRALVPVVETAFRRTRRAITEGGARIEVAVDVGEIRAGTQTRAHREIEFALIAGPPAALFACARRLLPAGVWHLAGQSKSDSGFALLAGGGTPGARGARAVPLTPTQTVETAVRDILAECLGQIGDNIATVLSDPGPEGAHQLRIGLRRLRTAWDLFGAVLGGAAAARLGQEAAWLAREVGALRDLDVARVDLVAPAWAAAPSEPGFASLDAALAARATDRRAALTQTLRGARVAAFVMDLAELIGTRGWLDPRDYDQSRALAQPVGRLAPRALDRAWARACARARGIDRLDIERRHDLRKALKKLRYALEFLGGVARRPGGPGFLRRLRALQERFGALNDLAMVETLLLGPAAPAADDPDAQRAVGLILGAAQVRAAETWAAARGDWRALAARGPFWA